MRIFKNDEDKHMRSEWEEGIKQGIEQLLRHIFHAVVKDNALRCRQTDTSAFIETFRYPFHQ